MAAWHYSIRDKGGEYGMLRIPVREPNGTTIPYEAVISTEEADFRSALEAILLGNIGRHHILVNQERPNDTNPASNFAQREVGIRVFLQSNTTQELVNFTVPAPDLAAVTLVPNTDLVDLGEEPMATFVEAVEDYYRFVAPDGTAETVTVLRAVVVGRNS